MDQPILIFDGHNDALMNYAPVGEDSIGDFLSGRVDRQLNLPKAHQGHLAGGLFAVFIEDDASMNMISNFDPSQEYVLPAMEFNTAQRMTMAMVANLYRIEAASNGQVKVVRDSHELEACIQQGVFATVLHFEGAEQIDTDFHALDVYYRAGLRSLGIVWSRPTPFGYGVPFKFQHSPDTGPGLTDAGIALVKACNQMGIMVDVSHLNEKGFWDVVKHSDAPVVASHSNAWAVTPLTRNLTDKQLDAIKESGGIVGVNFVTILAREDARDDADTPLETLVRHVDYLVGRVGIDHVGFGSDFGVASVPKDLRDVSHYPNLIAALRRAGYDEAALRKLGTENWLRVLRQTWKA
jgi:membrane dipeptidase